MKYFTKDWYERMQQMGNCGSQEEWERMRPEIEAPVDAYHAYIERENLTAIDRQLNFHDCRVLHARRNGNDFCLFIDYDVVIPVVLLRCVDAQILGQELSEAPNAYYVWLYHEIHLTPTGYELQILLAANGGPYEWSIRCARIERIEMPQPDDHSTNF